MNFRFSTALAALGCVLLASCYPVDESQHRRPQNPNQAQKSVTSPEQQKVQAQRDRLKAEEAEKRKEAQREVTPDASEPGASTTPTTEPTAPKPPVEEKRVDIPVAGKVPGKEGYVFSPFNNKLIDVRGIPSGTLVADPTYPESAKKHFRVP